jgi:hypothetical protein
LYPASNHKWDRRRNLSPTTSSMSGFIPSQSKTLAEWTFAFTTSPSVYTSRWRFLPFTFLSGS